MYIQRFKYIHIYIYIYYTRQPAVLHAVYTGNHINSLCFSRIRKAVSNDWLWAAAAPLMASAALSPVRVAGDLFAGLAGARCGLAGLAQCATLACRGTRQGAAAMAQVAGPRPQVFLQLRCAKQHACFHGFTKN